MGLSEDITNDLATFINADEHAVDAIFDISEPISVIFDNPSEPRLNAETGGIMMAGPQAIAIESEVPGAKGKTLKIGDIAYNIIEARPDGTGLTTLTLSRD